MLGNIGMGELLLILLATLLLFGAKRIPDIARGLGQGLREFRAATREIARELNLDEGTPSYSRPRSSPTASRPTASPGAPQRGPAIPDPSERPDTPDAMAIQSHPDTP